MITVYVIESLADQTWCTGMAINANNRWAEHNPGKNRFTKGHRHWKIIYTKQHPDWKSAKQREKYLKSAAGKKWLIKYLAGDTGSLPDCVTQAGDLVRATKHSFSTTKYKTKSP